MLTYSAVIAAVVSASLATAQTTVQSIFLASPSETNAWAGSVVGVDNGLTTYAIACTSGDSGCYTSSSITVTEGTSTFALTTATSTGGLELTISANCNIDGTTSATCTESVSASAHQAASTVVTSVLGTESFHYHPVTITAGADLLGKSGGSGSSSSSSGNGAVAPMATGGVLGMGVGVGAVVGLAAFL